jgi:hypothetical protein
VNTGALVIGPVSDIYGGTGIRLDNVGNIKIASTASIFNNSGYPILCQSGSIICVETFFDSGASTGSATWQALNSSYGSGSYASFYYTPKSKYSRIIVICTANFVITDSSGVGTYMNVSDVSADFALSEYTASTSIYTNFSGTHTLYSRSRGTGYGEPVQVPGALQGYVNNDNGNSRYFTLVGLVMPTSNGYTYCAAFRQFFTVLEVARE